METELHTGMKVLLQWILKKETGFARDQMKTSYKQGDES
jgi:hypothetical protein